MDEEKEEEGLVSGGLLDELADDALPEDEEDADDDEFDDLGLKEEDAL